MNWFGMKEKGGVNLIILEANVFFSFFLKESRFFLRGGWFSPIRIQFLTPRMIFSVIISPFSLCPPPPPSSFLSPSPTGPFEKKIYEN